MSQMQLLKMALDPRDVVYTPDWCAALVPPINPEIDVILVGDAREIKCRAGGCTRKERWEIGKAAFMQLMQRYGKVV